MGRRSAGRAPATHRHHPIEQRRAGPRVDACVAGQVVGRQVEPLAPGELRAAVEIIECDEEREGAQRVGARTELRARICPRIQVSLAPCPILPHHFHCSCRERIVILRADLRAKLRLAQERAEVQLSHRLAHRVIKVDFRFRQTDVCRLRAYVLHGNKQVI